MKAELILQERIVLTGSSFVEMVVWKLSAASPGSRHRFKYRLAYVVENSCVIRFDNEAGKGDHKHVGAKEAAYTFVDLKTLRADFFTEIRKRSRKK
jgi:Family of unknown function (DUF6516)